MWLQGVRIFVKQSMLQSFARRQIHKMSQSQVAVRSVEDDARIQISFQFGPQNGKVRVYNLDRLRTEEVGKSLSRISANVMKHLTKKKKAKKAKLEASATKESTDSESDILVKLFHQKQEVTEDISNSEAWVDGAVLNLGEMVYDVVVNQPNVKSLSLPENIMAGFPVYPKYDLEFADLENCKFTWYKIKVNSTDNETNKSETDKKNITESSELGKALLSTGDAHEASGSQQLKEETEEGSEFPGVVEVGSSHHYTPLNSDIGAKLKLVCTPMRGERKGQPVEVMSDCHIEAGPGTCAFEKRHLYTNKKSDFGSFRTVCYNILADTYADSDFSRTVLYPYCSPYALAIDYRKQLLLKEIIGYNADLICLQEVDRKVFEFDMMPALTLEGFHGLYKQKYGSVPEGSATFYRKTKFRLIESHNINVAESLENDAPHRELYDKICTNDVLEEKVMGKGSALQVSVLESLEEPGRKLCVATTHLYFHPKAPHVRLIQMAVCLQHLMALTKQYQERGEELTLLLCGDLNSGPTAGVSELLTRGSISADHEEWKRGGEEEYVAGLELSHNFGLTSACGPLRYTNYVGGFNDTLDYIYVEDARLEPRQVIPMPDHEDVVRHVALPNIVFPSDHLALVCDIAWKDSQ